jgi:predicted nucleic acid-binding protein
MNHGLDTGFLVAAEVREHAEHADARHALVRLLSAGDLIAIAPQVLAEFIHIVTDPRRFAQPLDMTAARQVAEQWWTARDVVRVFPDDDATRQFLAWLQQFSLGRKRLLDTLLAATAYRLAFSPSSPPIPPTSACSPPSPASHRRHPPRIVDEISLRRVVFRGISGADPFMTRPLGGRAGYVGRALAGGRRAHRAAPTAAGRDLVDITRPTAAGLGGQGGLARVGRGAAGWNPDASWMPLG